MKKLKTRWTDQVKESQGQVLQEYPRPSMKRESYLNLNGFWDYAIMGTKRIPDRFDGKILVPFSPEAPLSGVERQLRPRQVLWYKRILPREVRKENGKRWLLHFGAVDQFAAVYINKILVTKHLGGYLPFTADVTDALKEGENELLVAVRDFTDHSYYSRGKQKLAKGGMFYTAQSGIWQTVWMEQVPGRYITEIKTTPLFDEEMIEITVCSNRGGRFTVEISSEEMQPVEAKGEAGVPLQIPIQEMHPWSPEDPFLYQMTVTFGEDTVDSYFAMRKISAKKDEKGILRPFLNNRPYLQKGVLDQGYWPDGLYTAPTDEALEFDIKEMKRLGFNMLRKHIKIEPERWYYHCDRLGMLVWQDMVCGGRPYKRWYVTYMANAFEKINLRVTDRTYGLLGRREGKSREIFVEEKKETIRLLQNHPSIITWVLFNEGWGQFDAKEITAAAREQDETRLVDQASGWFDQAGGDFRSIHNYFFELKLRADKRITALTEFGGYCWRVREHSMYSKVYGYRIFGSKRELTRGYSQLMRKQIIPKLAEGLSVTIYTQLSDVEEEVNGIYTYDREMLKIEEEVLKEWNEQYDI